MGQRVGAGHNEHINVKVLWRKIPKDGGEDGLEDSAVLCYTEW